MRRALAALAAAEADKKARRAKNAEEKRAMLGMLVAPNVEGADAARGETKPVPEPETEEARRGARRETTKCDKIRAEAAAMGIQLVAEGDFEKGSESDKSDHLEARGSVGGSAEKDAADAARDADDDADDDDADDDAEEDDAEEDDAEDSRRPADGWRRAVAEMARLASLADAFSAADAMRRPAAVGASGPAGAPFGRAWLGADDGDDDGAFDGTRAENRGGGDLIGEPRRTLGGGGDVARDAAGLLNQYAFALAPAAPAPQRAPTSEGRNDAPPDEKRVSGARAEKPVALLATATDPRATASRLKELAECTGCAVLRGARGGGGPGGAGEAAERVAFLACMATLQASNREAAKARRRKPVTHLLASADVVAELEAVGRFGA